MNLSSLTIDSIRIPNSHSDQHFWLKPKALIEKGNGHAKTPWGHCPINLCIDCVPEVNKDGSAFAGVQPNMYGSNHHLGRHCPHATHTWSWWRLRGIPHRRSVSTWLCIPLLNWTTASRWRRCTLLIKTSGGIRAVHASVSAGQECFSNVHVIGAVTMAADWHVVSLTDYFY